MNFYYKKKAFTLYILQLYIENVGCFEVCMMLFVRNAFERVPNSAKRSEWRAHARSTGSASIIYYSQVFSATQSLRGWADQADLTCGRHATQLGAPKNHGFRVTLDVKKKHRDRVYSVLNVFYGVFCDIYDHWKIMTRAI